MLYGDVVKSNISKKIAEELKNNWNAFKKALKDLERVLKGMNIEVNRFSKIQKKVAVLLERFCIT